MNRKLIAVTLIAVLICVVVVNSFACTDTGTYTLTMSSTAGGSVTPAVGAHTYPAGTVVNLTATPDAGYRFVNWTGGGADIGSASAATTTITMNAAHTVTARFALGTLIPNVPDVNQPPTQILGTTANPTNYCAPMAMVNILEYWDDVINHANAQNVTAGLADNTTAEYVGYFMDTNNQGSPDRGNGLDGHLGTYNNDIDPGTVDFVRWDATHPPTPPPVTAPPFALPAGKLGYDWTVLKTCDTDYNNTLNFYKNEVDNGRPLVVAFDYWNPVDKTTAVVDPETGETINVFDWGAYVSYSIPPNPVENWDYGTTGHAVTGVGYILDWDPDGAGAIPKYDWVIVHDNWSTTPKNVAIPWAWYMCLWQVIP